MKLVQAQLVAQKKGNNRIIENKFQKPTTTKINNKRHKFKHNQRKSALFDKKPYKKRERKNNEKLNESDKENQPTNQKIEEWKTEIWDGYQNNKNPLFDSDFSFNADYYSVSPKEEDLKKKICHYKIGKIKSIANKTCCSRKVENVFQNSIKFEDRNTKEIKDNSQCNWLSHKPKLSKI